MFDDFVRTAFASCSTRGTARYFTKGLAIDAFNAALTPFGFCLEPDDGKFDYPGDSGRKFVVVWRSSKKGPVCAGYAAFNWHRTDGRYEFTGRLLTTIKPDRRITRSALRLNQIRRP